MLSYPELLQENDRLFSYMEAQPVEYFYCLKFCGPSFILTSSVPIVYFGYSAYLIKNFHYAKLVKLRLSIWSLPEAEHHS